jgi:Raf kinase inhibitor-like YbhB/YbcL family protein
VVLRDSGFQNQRTPMLEHIPYWLGQALRGLRAGADKLCIAQLGLRGDFGAIELRVSPPLLWGRLPQGTHSVALIVEDPDAPALEPLVHAIVWGIPPFVHALDEGAIRPDGVGLDNGSDVGRNSYFFEGWLPPDPPTGHGDHHYAFQLFALGEIDFPGSTPGRSALVKAMSGKVLGAGLLTGLYSRGEPTPIVKAQAGGAARIS